MPQVNIFQACCTILLFVTPSATISLSQCLCPWRDIYDHHLCPTNGTCNLEIKNAIIFTRPPLCPMIINCDSWARFYKKTQYVRFQFSDGTDLHVELDSIHQSDIQCINGQWLYVVIGSPAYYKTLRHLVCYIAKRT
ncbi:unnamed protein product [Cylicocyclus nassatus]|uniref:Secreted protein n=1 Tax=Cylicocyclus nassatus TaxID=53992 RepID=A0AA36DR19_CYLNA|nr:unnamed protein product [Cylicocyclus nassatus]